MVLFLKDNQQNIHFKDFCVSFTWNSDYNFCNVTIPHHKGVEFGDVCR
jgi:hypothetical protein